MTTARLIAIAFAIGTPTLLCTVAVACAWRYRLPSYRWIHLIDGTVPPVDLLSEDVYADAGKRLVPWVRRAAAVQCAGFLLAFLIAIW